MARKDEEKYGTQVVRLGAESQVPFGYCCLSLHKPAHPVASKTGHIYEREFILEYLLHHKRRLKRERRDWEEQRPGRSAAQGAEGQAGEPGSNAADAETEIVRERKKSLQKTSYWLPQFAPASEQAAKEPDRRPRSPMSGSFLRAKDLTPLRLVEAPGDGGAGGGEGGDARFLCALSRKQIGAQPCVAIKPSGHVFLKSVFESTGVRESGVCPVSGKAFRARDVLELQSGTSGYAASGRVEGRRWTPTGT